MSNARDFASRVPVDGALSNRNMVINGAMTVSQKGTSFANVTNGNVGVWACDRFRFLEQGTPTFALTSSQSTDAPSGFSNSLKFEITTAQSSLGAGDVLGMDTLLEAQDLQRLGYGSPDAKVATLSFWVKSNVVGTYVMWSYQFDDTRGVTKSYTIDAANTWEYKTIKLPADTTGIIDNNNEGGLAIRWILGAGSTYTSGTASSSWIADLAANRYVGQGVNVADTIGNTFQLTGVQLEIGDTPTPFEHEPYSVTLQKCQRYFQWNPTGVVSFSGGSNQAAGGVALPVALRSTPTITIVNGTDAIDEFYVQRRDLTSYLIIYDDSPSNVPKTSYSVFGPCEAGATANVAGCFMAGHWTLDAEL